MTKLTTILGFTILFALSAPAFAAKWYEGGSLHRSNIGTWHTATYQNKLATSADWVLQSPSVKNAVKKSGSIDTTKKYASQLVTCIDKAAGGAGNSEKTSGIAASCMVLMGWE